MSSLTIPLPDFQVIMDLIFAITAGITAWQHARLNKHEKIINKAEAVANYCIKCNTPPVPQNAHEGIPQQPK